MTDTGERQISPPDMAVLIAHGAARPLMAGYDPVPGTPRGPVVARARRRRHSMHRMCPPARPNAKCSTTWPSAWHWLMPPSPAPPPPMVRTGSGDRPHRTGHQRRRSRRAGPGRGAAVGFRAGPRRPGLATPGRFEPLESPVDLPNPHRPGPRRPQRPGHRTARGDRRGDLPRQPPRRDHRSRPAHLHARHPSHPAGQRPVSRPAGPQQPRRLRPPGPRSRRPVHGRRRRLPDPGSRRTLPGIPRPRRGCPGGHPGPHPTAPPSLGGKTAPRPGVPGVTDHRRARRPRPRHTPRRRAGAGDRRDPVRATGPAADHPGGDRGRTGSPHRLPDRPDHPGRAAGLADPRGLLSTRTRRHLGRLRHPDQGRQPPSTM